MHSPAEILNASRIVFGMTLLLAFSRPLLADDLEARAYSLAPVGTNFLAGNRTHLDGEVLLDSAGPIKDLQASIDFYALAYVHTFAIGDHFASSTVMPPYAFLANKDLDYHDIKQKLEAQQKVGVPYSKDEVEHASDDLEAQADPFDSRGSGLKKRYGAKIAQRDFDSNPDRLTEMDALIAYLQMLGTLVDFKTYHAEDPRNMR